MEPFWAKVKEEGILGFMKKLGVNAEEEYLVFGSVGPMLLMKVGDNLLEICSSKLRFVRFAERE